MASDYRFGIFKLFFRVFNYRLMHALFHIKTVIIPRDRYQPEGFSPRVDIRRGMITILIWKKACINLFITYFNIELRGLISCYQSFASISAHGLLSQWHFWCLRMGKIDVITYKYVIMVFNATFNNISVISWWSVILVEET